MSKRRVWVTLPKDVVDWIDKEVKSKRFKDYSHAIDYIVTDFMKRERKR